MSNWTGAARTNYVKHDPDAAQAFADKWNLTLIVDKEGRVGFHPCDMSDDGDFPGHMTTDDGEDLDFDWTEFTDTLADGEVLIVSCVGFEKLRYLTGYSAAYNNKGLIDTVSISDIHDNLKNFGLTATEASY